MMFSHDILSLTVFFIVLFYFAVKRKGKGNSSPSKMEDGRDFPEWYMKLCEKNQKRLKDQIEQMRYEKWLLEHRG